MQNTITTGAARNVTTIGQQHSGQGKGNGPRRVAGLLATAALGLTLLAGGVISQSRPSAQPASPQAASNPVAADTYVPSMWDTREDRRVDLIAAPFVPDQFTYREDHRQAAVPAATASAFVPDFFTYREDHRIVAASTFVPDQFTYREDRRAELVPALAPADFVPDFFTYREDRREGR